MGREENVDYTEREPVLPLRPPKMVADGWYLKGFADGYHARPAIMPREPLGEQYRKGYIEGLAAAERDVPDNDLALIP